MTAPTTPQVLTGLANAASERHRQVERAVALNGRPTRPLTKAELAQAASILRGQGCVPTEIRMRLGVNP